MKSRLTGHIRLIVFGGIIVRLVLLPFFTHSDLLTDYWVAHITACDGRLPIEANGGIYCFSVMHYFHSAWLSIVSALIPQGCDLWFSPWGSGASPGMTTAEDWFAFVSQRSIFPILFLLKLPYFAIDMIILAFVGAFGRGTRERNRLLAFWLLNPVGIFVTCIFGRYEVVPALFIVWSLLQLSRGKIRSGAILLGVALVIKLYAMMFVPLFAVTMARRWPDRVKLVFWAMLPGFIMIGIAALSGMFFQFSGFATLPHNDYMLGVSLTIHPNDEERLVDVLYVFIALYMLVLLHAERFLQGWKQYQNTVFIVLNLLYAFTFFHPHYFFWILPFWALKIAENRRFTFLFSLQVLCLVVYTFHWGRPLAGYLAGPISPVFFFSLPSPYDLINLVYPADKLINIARSVLTALCLWTAWTAYRTEGEETIPMIGTDDEQKIVVA